MNRIKIIFTAFFTALNSILGSIAMPFYILVLTNIIDYGTGLVASVCRGEKMSSKVGFHGIVKKVCMWLLVFVGMVMDYCVTAMGANFGIVIDLSPLVAAAVVFWLVANELISILENISDIGVPLPEFLMQLAELVRDKTTDGMK